MQVKEKLHLAHIVRFREILGAALTLTPSKRYDWGHSWLVETEAAYQEKMGEPVSLSSMPKHPKDIPINSSSAVQREYKRDM